MKDNHSLNGAIVPFAAAGRTFRRIGRTQTGTSLRQGLKFCPIITEKNQRRKCCAAKLAGHPFFVSITSLRSIPAFILVRDGEFDDYAKSVVQKMQSAGLRVTLDNRSEKIGAKIRECRLDLVPYLAVAGGKEEENNSVSLRSRKEGEVSINLFIEILMEEVRKRVL